MIITVTLNPALDKTVEIPDFSLDAVNRITAMRTDPGGKGLNVSKVIAKLGGTSTVVGVLGGTTGRRIADAMDALGIACQFTFVEGETRTNLKVIDPARHTNTDLNEPGLTVDQETLDHMRDALVAAIRPGDIVSIDTGAAFGGFNGDNACTFGCGKLDLEAQRLLDVTRESLHRGIAAAVFGARVGDISNAVQTYVEENGFSVVRSFVGHGVGKELHEDPEVPNFGPAGRGPRLVAGMTLAIEPMVNQKHYSVVTGADGWTVTTADGGLSAHFEHTVAITAAGPEVLTKAWEGPEWTL